MFLKYIRGENMNTERQRLYGILILGIITLCIMYTALSVKADTFKGERIDEQEAITYVDENGNITEGTDESGKFPEKSLQLRAEQVKIVNFNISGSRVTEYKNTKDSSIDGYTNGAYGADGAYLGTTDDGKKVKFMLAGVMGTVDASLVQLVNFSDAQSISYYTVKGGRLLHYITANMTKSGYASILDNGNAPSYLKEGSKYYSYDGHYFYNENQYAQMLKDYTNDNRLNSVNSGTPYYNYYQYLPLRSVTLYTENELNSMISQKTNASGSKMNNIAGALLENQDKYGVNALIVAGIAANESGWGTSNICQKNNNLFGLNAVDSNPTGSANSFSSINQCIKEFDEIWMSKQYMNPGNWKYAGAFLGNKESGFNVRYASDPYWGEKAAAAVYALEGIGGNKDLMTYTLGVKESLIQVNVRTGSSTSTNILFKTPKTGNTTYIIRNNTPVNKFYEIQSDGVLNANRTALNSTTGIYSISSMYCYMSSDYIKIISEARKGFKDVYPGDWYFDAVKYVSEIGVMTGKDSRTFAPGEPLARAQFAVMLWRMGGEEEAIYDGRFPDVLYNTWYTDAVAWSCNKKVITGYQDTGKFEPGNSISRQEMAVMLFRYAKLINMNTDKRGDLSKFEDYSSVAEYASEAMRWAVGSGIISGKYEGTQLDPGGDTTRAECAVMITRFYNYI